MTRCNSPCSPMQKIHVLQLQFENIDAPITLHNGTAYAAIPFAFSTGRFLLVLLIALGLTACKQFYRLGDPLSGEKLEAQSGGADDPVRLPCLHQ